MNVQCDICGATVFDGPLVRYERDRVTVRETIPDNLARVNAYPEDGVFYFDIRDSLGVGITAGVHNHSHDDG